MPETAAVQENTAHEKVKLLVISRADAPQLKLLAGVSDICEVSVGNSVSELSPFAPAAQAILIWEGKQSLLKEIFPLCKKLQWVHSKNAGIEPLLFRELIESSVVLTNSKGVYARSLAEFVIAGMLYFAKNMPRMLENKRRAVWEQFLVTELEGAAISIYGYGEIGKKTAEKAKALGMRVLAARRDPRKSEGDKFTDVVLPLSGLERLCREADYFVICAPATTDTKQAIGEKELRLMKPSCVLINIGRGSIVDEQALVSALRDGIIRGAVLDVFEKEPLPAEHPFWQLPNVFISPHTADQTATWLDEAMELFLRNCRSFAADEPLKNVCDKKAGY